MSLSDLRNEIVEIADVVEKIEEFPFERDDDTSYDELFAWAEQAENALMDVYQRLTNLME